MKEPGIGWSSYWRKRRRREDESVESVHVCFVLPLYPHGTSEQGTDPSHGSEGDQWRPPLLLCAAASPHASGSHWGPCIRSRLDRHTLTVFHWKCHNTLVSSERNKTQRCCMQGGSIRLCLGMLRAGGKFGGWDALEWKQCGSGDDSAKITKLNVTIEFRVWCCSEMKCRVSVQPSRPMGPLWLKRQFESLMTSMENNYNVKYKMLNLNIIQRTIDNVILLRYLHWITKKGKSCNTILHKSWNNEWTESTKCESLQPIFGFAFLIVHDWNLLAHGQGG